MNTLQAISSKVSFVEFVSVIVFSIIALHSVFNGEYLKAFIFLAGYLAVLAVFTAFTYSGNGNSISLGVSTMSYVLMYVITCVVMSKNINIPIIIMSVLGFITSTGLLIKQGEQTTQLYVQLLISLLVGALSSMGIFWSIYSSNDRNKLLLYFDNLVGGNKKCSVASNQKFKCAVYKNGQLVKQLN